MVEVKVPADRVVGRRRIRPVLMLGGLLVVCVAAAMLVPGISRAAFDICGCVGSPRSLGAFDTLDPASFPPGFQNTVREIKIPLPADGVLVFSSLRLVARPSDFNFLRIAFIPNETNTPVTILVSGDVEIGPNTNTFLDLAGSAPLCSDVCEGGVGGPGGFPGGDGAYQLVNLASDGGDGLGPGGGRGGTASPPAHGENTRFLGSFDLLPLVGGSGGGGGASLTNAFGCQGGGGGGGAGAILIAANGTITLNGSIWARGGSGSFSSCGTHGGHGGGGAVRLVANAIKGTAGSIDALPGNGTLEGAGAVRLEALSITLPAGSTNPIATRAPAPGPLALAGAPSVAITAVGGQPVPTPPRGITGAIDVTLPSAGVVNIDFRTTTVPSGTLVDVSVKPRVGGSGLTLRAPLNPANCNAAGVCVGAVAVDLPSGAYVIEARATFQRP
jgi:hypothetical protein